jgi:hypothetical protein
MRAGITEQQMVTIVVDGAHECAQSTKVITEHVAKCMSCLAKGHEWAERSYQLFLRLFELVGRLTDGRV